MAVERRVIRVGGKGSSLSSATVFEVANGFAQVRIDSSALAWLSSSNHHHNQQPTCSSSSSNNKFRYSLPNYLSSEECRASLLLLLNKLLLSPPLSPSTVDAANWLSDALNSNLVDPAALQETPIPNYSESSTTVIDDPPIAAAALAGVCALLDHCSSALCTIADAVAALSCEALMADVSAFNLMDSGDGSSAKDEVGVASDLKVLLNGSKLVAAGAGKVADYDSSSALVAVIPELHGSLREISRLVHSRARIELNSSSSAGSKGGGFRTGKALAVHLSPLALALWNLGENSRRRAKLVLDSIANDDLRSPLTEMFNSQCPGPDALECLYMSSHASLKQDYVKFAHQVYSLSEIVRKILSWEATAAFILLQGNEFLQKYRGSSSVPLSGEIAKANDKKNEKKKKVLLGKGTAVLMQLIRDSLLVTSTSDSTIDILVLLEQLVLDFLAILDPKDPRFAILLNRTKEILESNESRRLPKLPKGTRDFAKEQMAVREKAFSIIREVFKRHGAMALDTPVFELRETLMGKYGEDSKLIYDLADQGGELCSLRYDLTVPFARYVAMNGLTSFKRYQIAKVYRRDNPSKGRYREFYQCDFDIAGQYETMGPDFEVIKILTELLDELNIGDYEVKLNHRKLLDGMLDICGVPPEKFRTICSSIDKLDKLSFEQIKKEMVDEKGLTVEIADNIGTFVKERGHPRELLSKLKHDGSKFLENSASLLALNDLEILFKALEKSRCLDRVVFDLSLARGLDYYTGVIFEAVFKGAAQVGSIAAGGRYDNLVGMTGTKQVPAVGVSLGIERVFTIMEQLQKDQNKAIRPTETQILVSILGDDLSLGAELASELWDAKLKAEYMVHKRVMKHIDRARELRIPFMVIVGEKELNEGIVKLKDVVAAKEDDVPRNSIVAELQRRLNSMST